MITPPLRLSVLDLSPVSSGSSSAEALQNTLDLARLAEALGYTRYWLSEHHNTAFLASSAPEIVIGHIAQVTSHMRVGSGGIMLPNHTPLKVAETFRTLEALHPHRIDLGIGRAPGTDGMTARALRRGSREAIYSDDFPEQMDELLGFLSGTLPDDHPYRRITATPADAGTPDLYLLGSSDFSARLAAQLGLGFAFAHHINPAPAIEALHLYREQFHPSAYFDAPAALAAVSVICAETDEQADLLARSADLAILRLYQGRPGPLPSVAEASAHPYTPDEREAIRMNRARLFHGSPTTLREQLTRFAGAAGVSEIMILTMVHDHQQRRRSYELLAEVFALAPV